MDKNDIPMQKFVSQPSDNGGYEVAKWNEIQQQYIPMQGEVYPDENEANERAQQINKEYEEEIREKEKNDGNKEN